MLWGNLNSKQFQTYVSLGEQDIDNELYRRAGIETAESDRPNPMGPRPCAICGTVHGPDDDFCRKCGTPLSEAVIDELRVAEEQAVLLPEYQVLLKEFEDRLRNMQKQKKGL